MAKIIDYTIVISGTAGATEKRAAAFLQEKIKVISGKKIPVVTDDTAAVPLEIVLGKTNREDLDGMDFQRAENKRWEYVLTMKNQRFYITGLGVAPVPIQQKTAYVVYDDGHIGTAHGAYVFVEEILGYPMMFAAYCEFQEKPELEMPEQFHLERTSKFLLGQLPEKTDGPAMYVVPCAVKLEWQMTCIIFKTAAGKLIVIDGGREEDTEHVLQILETLSGGKKPVVSAWLFSHMHDDHYGVYAKLCREPALGSRVQVEHFYCHLLSDAFYGETCQECDQTFIDDKKILLDSEKTLGTTVHTVQKGDVIRVDEFAFEVIHIPCEERAADMNINDSSVVYKLNYNDQQSILLLGDAEWVCSEDMVENSREKLKSDVVQVGHHGCGNVSEACYRLIGAEYYIWQISPRFWYSDGGSGLNTRNTGVNNTVMYIGEAGGKPENQFRDTHGILSFPLPITTKK